MKKKILEVRNLSTRFYTIDGIVHAVNGISFDLYEGETLGIVGESGCGKSVSVLSILRLVPEPPARISAESLCFKGEDLVSATEDKMRRIRGSQIGMVFQDPMTSLNPVLTIGYQIMEPLRLHLGMTKNKARERTTELLRLVGIPQPHDRLLDYPHQFSGGMRQRAMIAMALACNPSILIADEPTTALDVTIQAQIVDLVKRLRDKFNMALIWITHDLGVVAGLADRVNVMYAGFVVETASIDDIYANPLHPYTNALLHSLPRMDESPREELKAIEGLPPELLELSPGCPFAPRCTHVIEKCWIENPPLMRTGNAHKVACWVDLDTGELR